MLTSRRLAFTAAAVLLGLSACGNGADTTTAGKSPAVIHLGAAPAASGGGAESATADKMMMPMQDITFVWDGGTIDLGATGPAWVLPAGAQPDLARVQQIAALLGVEGDVRELPADQGGGWMIGAADYTTASLTVSTDGMLSWWFSPAPSASDVSSVGCATPGILVDPAVDSVGGAAPTDPVAVDETIIVGDTAVAPPEVTCEEPQPPANVPDEATARAKAEQLFDAMGYDSAAYEYEVYADQWSANVTAWMMLGGHRSPIALSAGFGAEGAVTWASGSLAAPEAAADYPLVSIDAAIQRLNDESGQWMGYWGGPAMMSRAETVLGDSAETAPTAPETAVPAEVSTDQVGTPIAIEPPVCDAATDCVIEPMPELEPVTMHLTGAKLDLTMVWADDNNIWLLPAYTLSTDDGSQYTVIAVDDSFLALPDPQPVETLPVDTTVTEPVPVDPTISEPAPIETMLIDIDEASTKLVGLTLDEATKVADELGWTIRVTTLDGEPQVVTWDLRTDRVNLSVTNGVVTAVDNVG